MVVAGGKLNMLVYLNDVYGETEIESIKENIMLVSPYANFDCRSSMKRQFVRNGCMC